MKDDKLKGWLVLPDLCIITSEITSISKGGEPDEQMIGICPSLKDIKPHAQIYTKNAKGCHVVNTPYGEVMKLFVEALAELKESKL